MRLQAYLRERGLDDHLTKTLAIKTRRHRDFPNLVLLKYHQVDSPMGDPLVQECRGVILDEADDWRVVSRPYDKFFNAGEPHAAAIDWGSARVYDKLDGSLATLFFYRGAWRVATSGSPDASGAGAEGKTFAELFWEMFPGHGSAPLREHVCYMFELCHPAYPIVVKHEAPSLVLHGARDLTTMEELEPESVAERHGWPCARTFPLVTLEDCLAAAKALDGTKGEGYVVRDALFRRLKVKSPTYVALNHAKDGFSDWRLLQLLQAGEMSETVAYFPEIRARYEALDRKIDRLGGEIEAEYARLPLDLDMKAFAAEAKRSRFFHGLIALRRGRAANGRAYLLSQFTSTLEEALQKVEP